ncbi:hypothetical protein JCM11251_000901 [Rhodosporidiobolus azoricus]
MPVTTIKSEEQYFNAIKDDGAISAIQFVAPWDESCKAISPKFKAYSDSEKWNSQMKFYRVDICDQQDVAMDSGVEMAPTFHFYRAGNKVKEYVGSSYPALERTMGAVLAGH